MVPLYLKTSISFDRPAKKERGVPASEASLLVDITAPPSERGYINKETFTPWGGNFCGFF